MSTAASLNLQLLALIDPVSPVEGGKLQHRTPAADTQRWSAGTGSGQINRSYKVAGTLTAGASVTYNFLAAGALKDANNVTIDLDEVKAFIVECVTGAISVTSAAANGLACYTGASEGDLLAAGHITAKSFGPAGLAVGSNGSLTVTETTGLAGATFTLHLIGAE
jgi:hypothetical protein